MLHALTVGLTGSAGHLLVTGALGLRRPESARSLTLHTHVALGLTLALGLLAERAR